MTKRACNRVNPSLWAQFQKLRKELKEPEVNPNEWTSPAVSAWINVRKPKEPDPHRSLIR